MSNAMLACQNPGWIGPGIPGLKKTLRFILNGITSQEPWPIRLRKIRAALTNFFATRVGVGQVMCPCCAWRGRSFLASTNGRAYTANAICPQCGSRSRHRGLVHVFETHLKNMPHGPVLLFAPERIMVEQLTRHASAGVITTDLFATDVDEPHQDIQQLTLPLRTYAALVCNHVLEHVENDAQAIKECARVLHADGVAIFTIPGDFWKNETVEYGKPMENGHWRHYGLDVVKHFQNAFASVTALDMSTTALRLHGVRAYDFVFVCRKPR